MAFPLDIIQKSAFKIDTIEMHTVGDTVRIVVSGFPKVSGKTIIDKQKYVEENLDHLRKAVMAEPRGHYNKFGALLVAADNPQADMAAFFIHGDGYGVMCGHGTMALARYALEFGVVQRMSPETPVNLQYPCGLVKAFVEYDGETKVSGRTRFLSVPAYVFKSDVAVELPSFGKVTVDISYGGEFYAIVSANQLGLDIQTAALADVVAAAKEVSKVIKQTVKLEHPDSPDLAYLNGTLVTDGKDAWSEEPTAHVCVYGDEQVCRSPCGSGCTARVALQLHKGLLDLNQTRTFQSGPVRKGMFKAKAVEKTTVGERHAVVVEVSGHAHFLGQSTFICESGDEIGEGFLIG